VGVERRRETRKRRREDGRLLETLGHFSLGLLLVLGERKGPFVSALLYWRGAPFFFGTTQRVRMMRLLHLGP
jgi:hypothetical protein